MPVVCVASLTLFFFVLLGLFKLARLITLGTDSLGIQSLKKAYQGITILQTPAAGECVITFRTYTGLLVIGAHQTHHLALTTADALVLLKRLHCFNLKYGWFYPGGLFIPLVSCLCYFSQTRKIRSKVAASLQDASHKGL
ncbi:hypothetical protein [Pedosphaera parvula]|uniref:hypothetical protein n=1 Tax=Pedosphaera parvula TaxID=1032527 RepID=UPI0005917A67|nr:hypothetical protein [Pedosphaera parvula]